MSYAILRTAKLKSMGEIGGSLAHNYRTRDTPNADPECSHLNEHHGGDTPEQVIQAIRDRLPEKRRSDAVLCVEYLITASPEHFDRDGGTAYFAHAVDWLKQRHGAENVVATTVHRDETTPHLVAYVVPIDSAGKLNAKHYLGGKAKLSAMQTDFADQVGRAHGLERGVEGSKATHKTIREYYQRANQQSERAPSVNVPDPTMAERLNPRAYGQRVAESVIQQIRPKWQELQAKASEAETAKQEAAAAKAAYKAQGERLKPLEDAVRPLNAKERQTLLHVVQRTSEKLLEDRQARQRQELEARQAARAAARENHRGRSRDNGPSL